MYSLAISPCPNDTFAFYGLLHQKTSWKHELDTRFADIEELNRLCFEGKIDFCKISFHAWLYLREHYQVLETGSALGFGCGPLIVAREGGPLASLCNKSIAVPGEYTTATLLLKLLLGPEVNTVEMVFDKIMPAVASGDVDAGLIIHESRFTFADHGLVSRIDLGDWWERESGCAIPLGGIVARRDLPADIIESFQTALGESIELAWADREQTIPFMRQHAQEMDARVMNNHVDLYVNDFTRGLGQKGHEALDYLLQEATRKGLFNL